jgi:shikimate dehydrogenase
MKIGGRTKIVCLLGDPVEHTLSPLIHNHAFERLGIDACYVAFRVRSEDIEIAVRAIKALNMMGANVTIPHKQRVMEFLDSIDEEARFIGAVNTITNKDGHLRGYNTDGRGFMKSLDEEKIEASGKNIVIIGAGGAARAIGYYLAKSAASLSFYDIDKQKCEILVQDLKKINKSVAVLSSVDEIDSPDILINATPLGLKDTDPLPINPEIITPEMVVCDLVYKTTPLLKEAIARGARTIDGSGMLLWQGILAFELWTGKTPPVEEMRGLLLNNIK